MKFEIENYDQMTPEEKVAALEAWEPDMSGYVPKSAFDKTSSDLAKAKKNLADRMTEDEQKKAQEAQEKADLMARVEQLEHEKQVSSYVASYVAMGYSEKLARSSAEALAKGDMDKVFANQKIRANEIEQDLRAELIKGTPEPKAGNAPAAMTREQIKGMSLDEQIAFAEQNPEIYKTIYGGNE